MENVAETPLLSPKGTFPATVVAIINNRKLVINRGASQGIREGQRMLVYTVSAGEIQDPNTGESLGHLEIVRGTGKIVHVQEKMATLESDQIQSKKVRMPSWIKLGASTTETIEEEENQVLPFENPQVADIVKPI